jgi:hypothetical protein
VEADQAGVKIAVRPQRIGIRFRHSITNLEV